MPPWRPGSTVPLAAKNETPVSANSPLVNCGPKWQTPQFPLPTNIFNPRCAPAGYRAMPSLSFFSSESLKSSKVVRPLTSVSWNAARALPTSTRSSSSSSGGLRPNALSYSLLKRLLTRFETWAALDLISRGSRSGRMLCAHRLSLAPSQPNQRPKRTLSTLCVLRSTSSSPKPRGRPSWKPRNGTWQVAHSTEPVPERRGSKNSRSPSATASAFPETRLLGSRTVFGGHGPCARIFRLSSSENLTASESEKRLVNLSVLPLLLSSKTNSQLPGIWNIRPSASQRPGPSAVTEGA